MFKRLTLIVAMVLCMAVPAMALDTGACGDAFVYHGDWNVTCQGRLELHDMGHFNGGTWVWNQDFLDEYNANNYTQTIGDTQPAIPAPVSNSSSGVELLYGRLDNRVWAESRGRDADSRFVFQGEFVESSGYMIPAIWKFKVEPLGVSYSLETCPDGPFVNPPFGVYCDYETTFPLSVDPETGLECYDINSNTDCTPIYPDNGLITINNNGIGYLMDLNYDESGPVDVIMISEDTNNNTPVTFDDVVSVEWVEGAQTRLPYVNENANFFYIDFNANNNQYDTHRGFWTSQNEIYFQPFEGQVPIGPQTFVINLVNGYSLTINADITSNTLMPVVAKYTEGLEYTNIKNNSKSKKKTKDITVANLIANKMINDNGEEILVIQFAEPDRAMALTNPNSKLRIWVGEPDMVYPWPVGSTYTVDFLWINAPLHTGSIVVPADAWAAIKARSDVQAAGEVAIGGMYREQFPALVTPEGLSGKFQYHNRGYIDSITVPIQ